MWEGLQFVGEDEQIPIISNFLNNNIYEINCDLVSDLQINDKMGEVNKYLNEFSLGEVEIIGNDLYIKLPGIQQKVMTKLFYGDKFNSLLFNIISILFAKTFYPDEKSIILIDDMKSEFSLNLIKDLNNIQIFYTRGN